MALVVQMMEFELRKLEGDIKSIHEEMKKKNWIYSIDKDSN